MQYWVGGFFIDLSRNQITQNKQSQTMAPKALAVLTYLAENQGKVISQDELLTQVWQDTAVSPNTLQRSIAQLRKALGDDGKLIIKTHAKQGYSLECDVRWQDTAGTSNSPNVQEVVSNPGESNELHISNTEPQPSEPPRNSFRWVYWVIVPLFLAAVGYMNQPSKSSSQLAFDQLRLLTATDDKEFDATYSPDGQYIVFHRYKEKQCVNKIWAKHIETQQEIQLTKDWAAYGRHSFSKDGSKMVFLATEACETPETQRDCYDLVTLDFAKALESPQQPEVVLQCKNSVVKKPIWLNDDHVALFKLDSSRWKLIKYSMSTNEGSELYALSDGNLFDYAYSPKDDLIAVSSIHSDEKHYIDMIKPDGQLVSSHAIKRPAEIPKHRPIYPNFSPLPEQLIFSTGRQLFTLSYSGEVSKISSPFADIMVQPEFHPEGNKLLMIKGPYDSDIVKLPLNQMTNSEASFEFTHQNYPSIERTNLGEDYAIFQPGGDSIAFWSTRSGESQIWVTGSDGTRQITGFPLDTYIRGFDWAEDGKSLLINANSALIQVQLDSTQKSYPIEHSVVRLYQWDSVHNTALLLLRINGALQLVEYDLNELKIIDRVNKSALWALKSQDGRLIYKDPRGRFWQRGPVEDERIEVLDGMGGQAKSFVIYGNTIYCIDRKNQLWSYDLNTQSFAILGEVKQGVDYLTDVNQSHLLMTFQVSAKKEVVELSLEE
ncbi:winged helix-turn-helix domain-containing protein [Pleionea sp. CnH1-48]|uniref:winged helix-turn-helix domain-containing protein n=1 Tax=Pleionea sp. CnH1-48 TaxID=2954494 RepID=UPI00209742C7